MSFQASRITGSVRDSVSAAPIAFVLVQANLIFNTATDFNGNFNLPVPPGNYTVKVISAIHAPAQMQVSVGAGQTAVANFSLTRTML